MSEKIYGIPVVTPICPDGTGGGGSSGGGVTSWNDIPDKPFGETVIYAYDKDGTYDEVYELAFIGDDTATYIKISDETPNKEFFIGKTLKFEFTNGEPSDTVIINENLVMSNIPGQQLNIAMLINVLYQEYPVSDEITLTPGVWFCIPSSTPIGGIQISGIKTIDEEYIPDTIARVYPRVLYEWDESVVYSDLVAVDGTYCSSYAKISDDAPEMEFFIGKILRGQKTENGETTEVSTTLTENLVFSQIDGTYVIDYGLFIVVTVDSCEYEGYVFTKGIWCRNDYIDTSNCVSKAQILDPGKPIDESLIPDTIARVADIEKLIPSGGSITEEKVQEMIDTALGVIANGTY